MELKTGVIIKRTKGFYYVSLENKVTLCRIKGNLFQYGNDDTIAVGDKVEVDPDASEDAGWIYRILPRHSKLVRSSSENGKDKILASNVDNLLIVSSTKNPRLKLGLIDRFIITAHFGNIDPIIVINKLDLIDLAEIKNICEIYEKLAYKVILTSIPEKKGLEKIYQIIHNKISVLAGHSGVGKSSILKAIFPEWDIKIGNVSKQTRKGKHTTAIAQMYPIPNGGYVVDTPGIRALDLPVSKGTLSKYFIEFEKPAADCYFNACTHIHEPECGIKKAVKEGLIAKTRYDNYCSIYASLNNA